MSKAKSRKSTGSNKAASAAGKSSASAGAGGGAGAARGASIPAVASPATWRNDDLTGAGKVAWWALVALAFMVPIALGTLTPLGGPQITSDIYDTFKVLLLRVGFGVALLAWVVDIVRNGGKVRYTPVFWVFLGFLALAGLSTFFSISPATAFFGKYKRYDGFWSYLIYGGAMFLAVQYATIPGRIKQLAQAIAASSVLVALYGLLQYAGGDILEFGALRFEENRSFSTFGNPDMLAGFLAFGIFISLGLAMTEGVRSRRILYWVAFLLNLGVTITAFSRSIWVGAVVGFAAIIVFAIRQRVRLDPVDWTMSGLTGVVATAFILGSLNASSAVMNFAARVVSIFDFGSGSAGTRFMIWSAALQGIADRPLLGFGLDTFRLIFRRYQPADYATLAGFRSVADSAHNFPLQLAVGAGVPAAVLFYGTAGWAAVASAKVCWQLPPESASAPAAATARGNRVLLAAFWAAAAAYVTHLMFGLSLPATTFLLFLSAGVLLSPTARAIEVEPLDSVVGYGAVALASVLAVASVWGGLQIAVADHAFSKGWPVAEFAAETAASGDYEVAASQVGSAIPDLQSAVRLSPWNDEYRAKLQTALQLRAQLAVENRETDATQFVSNAVAFSRDTLERNPWEYDNVIAAIQFYNGLQRYRITDYLEEALELGETNVALMPNGLALRFAYADTLYLLGERDLAIEQLEYAIKYDPNHTLAIELLDEIKSGSTQAPPTAP